MVTGTDIIAWTVLILGFFLAAVGTILPGLPGAAFVLAGILIHKWLLPDVFSWTTIAFIAGLAILSWLIDLFSGYFGAKMGGATKKGLIGAAVGGLLGIPLGLPGLILGPFVGAIAGDLIARRDDLILLFKSGAGAALGFIVSLILRFVVLGIMIFVVLLAAVF